MENKRNSKFVPKLVPSSVVTGKESVNKPNKSEFVNTSVSDSAEI